MKKGIQFFKEINAPVAVGECLYFLEERVEKKEETSTLRSLVN